MNKEEFSLLFDQLMADRRDEMRAKYNRVLPSGELIFNRVYELYNQLLDAEEDSGE